MRAGGVEARLVRYVLNIHLQQISLSLVALLCLLKLSNQEKRPSLHCTVHCAGEAIAISAHLLPLRSDKAVAATNSRRSRGLLSRAAVVVGKVEVVVALLGGRSVAQLDYHHLHISGSRIQKYSTWLGGLLSTPKAGPMSPVCRSSRGLCSCCLSCLSTTWSRCCCLLPPLLLTTCLSPGIL